MAFNNQPYRWKNNAVEENFISIDNDLSEKTFENEKPQVIK